MHALLTGSTRCCTADAPFWQHPGHLVFLPAVPARFKQLQAFPAAAGTSSAPNKTPKASDEDAPQNQPGARERNPSVVQLLEQPTIYRGSSLWCAPLQPSAMSAWSIDEVRACLCSVSARLWSGCCMHRHAGCLTLHMKLCGPLSHGLKAAALECCGLGLATIVAINTCRLTGRACITCISGLPFTAGMPSRRPSGQLRTSAPVEVG